MVESLSNATVTQWLSAVTSTNTKCWAENPESVKEAGFMSSKSYTTYRVLLKASDGELTATRHRFSDFDVLRDNLRAKFFSYGLMVPALPPKKLTGTQDREFLTERMQGLTLLCEELVSFPWFRKDPIWLEFMGSQSLSHSPTGSSSDTHAPEDILTFMCSQLPLPFLPLERLCEVKEEIVQWEKKLKVVLENLKNVQAAAKQLQCATASLAGSLMGLNEVVATSVTHTTTATSTPTATSPTSAVKYLTGAAEEMSKGPWGLRLQPHEEIPTLTAALTDMVTEKVGYKANSAEYLNILFHSLLEREVARCSSIKELLKYHDDLCSSIESITVQIEKTETKKAQTEKIKNQLKELKVDLEEKNFLMNTFYKGFFYFTVPLAVKGRSENLRKMCECVGAYELVEGSSQQQSAASLLSTANASAVKAVTDTRAMLDLLSLCPLGTLQHEEELLAELGILPGMSHSLTTSQGQGHDWLVEMYKAYSNGSSDEHSDEHSDDHSEVLTPNNNRGSSHSQFSPHSSPTKLQQQEECVSDAVTSEQEKVDEDVTEVDINNVTLSETSVNDDATHSLTHTHKPVHVSSDSLDLLTSSSAEQERRDEAERNRRSLFGD